MIKAALFLALVASAVALPRRKYGMGVPGRIVGGGPANPNVTGIPSYGISSIFWKPSLWSNNHPKLFPCYGCSVGPANSFTVKAGKHRLYESESSEQVRQIESLVIHPDYPGPHGFSNDIAILKTTAPFAFNGAVAPIPISPAGHLATGTARIVGWGTVTESGNYPDVLQKAELPIISDDVCRQSYGNNFEDSMICAGFAAGGTDSCEGDSGGPLTANDRGYTYLAGVTSWGAGCALPGFPGVYTEISHHVDFIFSNAN